MARYLIKYGSVKTGDAFKGVGEVVELSEEEAKLMDPSGDCLSLEKALEAKPAKPKEGK